jgi:hypothetical protein
MLRMDTKAWLERMGLDTTADGVNVGPLRQRNV